MAGELRVLHVTGSLDGGGIQTFLLALLKHQRAHGLRADVVCMSPREGELADQVRSLGSNVYTIPLKGNPVNFAVQLRSVIDNGYDAIHGHRSSMLQAFPLMVARLAGVPVRVAHFQNISNPKSTTPRFRRWMNPVLRSALTAATTTIVCVSRAVADSHFNGSSRRPLNIIPNAIDINVYTSARERREMLRAQLGLAPTDFAVIHTGRFSPAKNQESIVRLAKATAGTMPDARFLLAGDGPLRAECEALARELGVTSRVRFLGWQENMAEVLAAGDAFFFPSRWEGMPLAVIEAMAAGLPCVTSNITPCREALPESMWRLRVPVANPLRAAPVLAELANDHEWRARLGAEALAHARQFDIDAIAQRVALLYRPGRKDASP